VQRIVGRARRGGDAELYGSGRPLAFLVFAAARAGQSQRGARALDDGTYSTRRVTCAWAAATISDAGARQIWCGYREIIRLLVLHSARLRHLVLPQRAAVRLVGGAQCGYSSSYRPGICASRGALTHYLPQRSNAIASRLSGRYGSADMPVHTLLGARSRFLYRPAQGIGEGARTPNVCVYARRWLAVERDKPREGKGDIKNAQLTCRASGVACNALLGGPGAAVTLEYIARAARWRFSYSLQRPQRKRSAVPRTLTGGAYTARRATCARAGAMRPPWRRSGNRCGYIGARSVLIRFAARLRHLSCRNAWQRDSSAERSGYISIYCPGIRASRSRRTLYLPHRVPRDGLAPQWNKCPVICRSICFSTPPHVACVVRHSDIRGRGTHAQRLRLRAPPR